LADGSSFDPADPIAALQSMAYSQFTESVYFEPTKGFANKRSSLRN
jgi:methyl coenzyme M reductase gamma subunit